MQLSFALLLSPWCLFCSFPMLLTHTFTSQMAYSVTLNFCGCGCACWCGCGCGGGGIVLEWCDNFRSIACCCTRLSDPGGFLPVWAITLVSFCNASASWLLRSRHCEGDDAAMGLSLRTAEQKVPSVFLEAKRYSTLHLFGNLGEWL